MRKWHRWLGIIFSLLLIFVAGTGIALTAEQWISKGIGKPSPGLAGPGGSQPGARPPNISTHPGDSKPDPIWLHHLLLRLHNGEMFGPVGQLISMVIGLTLLFFAISGMWMYIKMYQQRRKSGRLKFFWDR
ncbi:MAG: PepSY domain-containing protein [Alphaproteobacteria bacterium]|nr:PepSY domain-containing protein [Alphaproteobacteria bacterium]